MEDLALTIDSIKHTKQVSSRWIAAETGKQHKNVLRDIREYFSRIPGSNLSHLREATEISIPATEAIIILSRYRGGKADKALALVRHAVDSLLADKKQAKLPARKKHQAVIGVQRDLFGNLIEIRQPMELSQMNRQQRDEYRVRHSVKVAKGLLSNIEASVGKMAGLLQELT